MEDPRSRIICLESNRHISVRIGSYTDDVAPDGVYEVESCTIGAFYDGEFMLQNFS